MLKADSKKAHRTLRTLRLDPEAKSFKQEALARRNELIESGDFEKLEALALAVIEVSGEDRDWLRDVGMARLFLTKYPAARSYLRKSLALDVTSPDSHGYLGLCLLCERFDGEAKGEFEHARGYARAQAVGLPDVVEGFAVALIDGDQDRAAALLQPYLGSRAWQKVYERIVRNDP